MIASIQTEWDFGASDNFLVLTWNDGELNEQVSLKLDVNLMRNPQSFCMSLNSTMEKIKAEKKRKEAL